MSRSKPLDFDAQLAPSGWTEWYQKQLERLPKKKQTPPPPKDPKQKEPAPTRPITEEELYKLRRLQHVRKAWWCGDGRFIEQFIEANLETKITERQAWYISVLWYKYRKQIGVRPPKPAGYV